MNQVLIFYPVFALVLLSLVVSRVLYVVRRKEIREKKLRMRDIALSGDIAKAISDTRSADNYRNLFEMPVLFYVLCVVLYVTQGVNMAFLVAAWLYVALRYAHTYVHCTSNRVKYRFIAFAVSAFLLGGMWCAWFAVQITK
ncbi:MAG: hypothetical protein RLZZ502_1076 [Pseudomonadota bacterium]|jgi:hypothetical protein